MKNAQCFPKSFFSRLWVSTVSHELKQVVLGWHADHGNLLQIGCTKIISDLEIKIANNYNSEQFEYRSAARFRCAGNLREKKQLYSCFALRWGANWWLLNVESRDQLAFPEERHEIDLLKSWGSGKEKQWPQFELFDTFGPFPFSSFNNSQKLFSVKKSFHGLDCSFLPYS